MKAEYKDGATPGLGVIIVSEGTLPLAPWAIAVQRGADRLFLCGNQAKPWVGDRAFVPLSGTAQADGSIRLDVGPAVVDQLDPREQYRFTLRGSDREENGRLYVASITHSRDESTTVDDEPAEKPTDPPDPPQPGNTGTLPPLDTDTPPQPAPGRRRLWRIALLAALALACVLWYVLDPRKGEETPPENAPQHAPHKETPQLNPVAAASVADQVRQFFQAGNHSPREAVELAQNLPQKTPEEQDAVYRLWYFAAENGDPSAYLPYAQILDPTTPTCGSIEKNGAEAWAMYEKARGSRAAEALAAQEKLRQYLEERAAQGDARARQWLEQINQMR